MNVEWANRWTICQDSKIFAKDGEEAVTTTEAKHSISKREIFYGIWKEVATGLLYANGLSVHKRVEKCLTKEQFFINLVNVKHYYLSLVA